VAAAPPRGRATAEVARSRAAARAAAAARRPTVSASATLAIDLAHPTVAPGVPAGPDYTPTAPLGSAAITASWPLLDVAARRARASAAADLRGAEASQLEVARRTALVAADAVVAVLAATRAAALTRQACSSRSSAPRWASAPTSSAPPPSSTRSAPARTSRWRAPR
jgi:outer membrane protein TolC